MLTFPLESAAKSWEALLGITVRRVGSTKYKMSECIVCACSYVLVESKRRENAEVLLEKSCRGIKCQWYIPFAAT